MRYFVRAIYCIYIIVMRFAAILALVFVHLFKILAHFRCMIIKHNTAAYAFVIAQYTPVFVFRVRVWAHIRECPPLLFKIGFTN